LPRSGSALQERVVMDEEEGGGAVSFISIPLDIERS
jgi:hypothetical protein